MDIQKMRVVDERVLQDSPKFAVQTGPLSSTVVPFNAISASSSQATFNVISPSTQVYMDRALDLRATYLLRVDTTVGAGGVAAGAPVFQHGADWSLCAFPIQSAVSTLTATINNVSVNINQSDVLNAILRLADSKKARASRTAPTMLDSYASYADSALAVNNALGGFNNACDAGQVPNGAWVVQYTDANGVLLAPSVASGLGYNMDANAQPIAPAGGLLAGAPLTFYIRFTATEKLVLSPFIFSSCHENEVGLFGLSTLQIVLNFGASQVARIVRLNPAGSISALTAVAFNATASSGPVQDARINALFCTPPLSTPLPSTNIINFYDTPRYSSVTTLPASFGAFAPNASAPLSTQITSQTITLNAVPDLIVVWAKLADYANGAYAGCPEWYFPISNITLNFDNYSGLMSTYTKEQLYELSKRNSLDMSWEEWSGQAMVSQAGTRRVGTVGGPLVIKPGVDFGLATGLAPSVVGQFVLNMNVTIENPTQYNCSSKPAILYIMTINSGFLSSVNGSSSLIRGVLSEADVMSAPMFEPAPTVGALERYVGGASFFSKLGNVLSKARDIYHATKPAVSAVKGALAGMEHPSAKKVADVLGAVGYGKAFGAHGGLAKRLM
jgi:hypothetical protein